MESDMEILQKKLLEIFEVDTIKPTDKLRDFELWDSLGVISILGVIDEHYGINMDSQDFEGLITVGDVYKFIESHRNEE